MTKTKTYKIVSILLLVAVSFSVSACTKGGDGNAQKAYKKETLVWWNLWDNSADVQGLIAAYKQLHPNVRIDYHKLRYDEYEQELVEALAEDRGPDVFTMQNTWVKRYMTKLLPAPDKVVTPIKYIKGSIKKEEIVEFRTTKLPTPAEVRKKYLAAVSLDTVVVNDTSNKKSEQIERVWGLPMSMDSLVMYYNKDILNNAGIVEPASNWNDFQEHVKRITQISKDSGQILLSGTAMGTADNVERNFDILSLLMMQNLTPMTNAYGQATFTEKPEGVTGVSAPPAIGAVEYYTQFASPLHEVYTWNKQMPNSIDAFIDGKVAYVFGYAHHRERIRAEAPQLDFNVAPVPQVGDNQRVNYASYWVQGVSKKTEIKDYAWDFVNFITSEKNVVEYLNETQQTTALRSTKLINEHLANELLSAKADQLLTAKSWYRGESPIAAEGIFNSMINYILEGTLEIDEAIENAASQINYSIKKKL